MRRFAVYLLLQCRRALRLLPHALLITALLAGAAGLAAVLLAQQREADSANQLALVGVVGDDSNPYVRIGIDALATFDVSRDEMQFLFMDEATALRELRAGRLSAMLYLPDDFVESIYAGEAHPIRFVLPAGEPGLNSLLTAKLAESVARLMIETENAQYGAQQYARDFLPDADPYEVDNELVDRYFAMVLSRHKLFSVQTVGLADTLSFAGYYLCGLAAAFLLLWGISGGPLFDARSSELSLVLRARGLGALGQVLGEYVAYLLLMLVTSFLALGAAWLLLRRGDSLIPELADAAPRALIGALALGAACLSSMQFFLYELAPAAPGSILLQFLCAAAQGYVCGCFYPAAFFPEAVQRLGALLPAHSVIRGFSAALRGVPVGVWPALGWTAGFLLLSAAARAWRLAREGGR